LGARIAELESIAETKIREAVSRREEELRAMVSAREAEVHASVQAREAEVVLAVQSREAELSAAWSELESRARDLEARAGELEEARKVFAERAEEVGEAERELEERVRELDGVEEGVEEGRRQFEEGVEWVRSRVDELRQEEERLAKLGREVEERERKLRREASRARSSLEEVQVQHQPIPSSAQPASPYSKARALLSSPPSILSPLPAPKSDALARLRSIAASHKPNASKDPLPSSTSLAIPVPASPSPFPALTKPLAALRTPLPAKLTSKFAISPATATAPMSAMKGVVLTATGEALATPLPGLGGKLEFGRVFDSPSVVKTSVHLAFKENGDDTEDEDGEDGDNHPAHEDTPSRKPMAQAQRRSLVPKSSSGALPAMGKGHVARKSAGTSVEAPSGAGTKLKRPSVGQLKDSPLPSSKSNPTLPLRSTTASLGVAAKRRPSAKANAVTASAPSVQLYDPEDEENLPSPFLRKVERRGLVGAAKTTLLGTLILEKGGEKTGEKGGKVGEKDAIGGKAGEKKKRVSGANALRAAAAMNSVVAKGVS
jgi:NIMA (never in mitosis gene a)-related kinase